MAQSDLSWNLRYTHMGDAAERAYLNHCDGKAERWGLNRPQGTVHVPTLPIRVRAAPDYLTNNGFVECKGVGRPQTLKFKLETWDALRWWSMLMPVHVFINDSHKKRCHMIGLDALTKIVNTPDAITVSYFDKSKLVFEIPMGLIVATVGVL